MRLIPQHLSLITLGTDDLPTIRTFYARWGWGETAGSEGTWCAFDLGGILLSFYSMDDLAREAAATPRHQSEWGGFTLAINLASEADLTRTFELALEAGAVLVADLQQREWGGTSGYIADPDGNRWELATGGPNPAPDAGVSVGDMDLAHLQDVIERTYGERDRGRGVPSTVAWLAEEVGELAQAVRKGDRAAQEHEFADVLAWVASLANQMGIDLSVAVERYADGCPRCLAIPCGCP